jgi:hypothetical protein
MSSFLIFLATALAGGICVALYNKPEAVRSDLIILVSAFMGALVIRHSALPQTADFYYFCVAVWALLFLLSNFGFDKLREGFYQKTGW